MASNKSLGTPLMSSSHADPFDASYEYVYQDLCHFDCSLRPSAGLCCANLALKNPSQPSLPSKLPAGAIYLIPYIHTLPLTQLLPHCFPSSLSQRLQELKQRMASWVDLTRSCNTATSAEHKRVTRDLQGDLNKAEKSIVTLRSALKAMAAGGARFGHITPAILARRTESVDSASAVCVHLLALLLLLCV